MVRRRRFNPLNESNRLRMYTTLVHRPLTAHELAHGVRTLRITMIAVVAVILLLVVPMAYRSWAASKRSLAVVEGQLKSLDSNVRERAMRIAMGDSLYHNISCLPLLDAMADTSARMRSAAIPALTAALSSEHCTGQLLFVLDTTQSGSARQRLLQIVAATGERMAQAAHRSLLRALKNDSASEGAAAIALAKTLNRSTESLTALRAAFREGRGIARTEALTALLQLEPRCTNIHLASEATRDADPLMRRLAIESLEPVVLNRSERCDAARALLQNMFGDPSAEVRAAARSLLLIAVH